MKIRAKSNGNILEESDERAQELIATGIYEAAEEGEAPKPKATTPSPSPKPAVVKKVVTAKVARRPAARKTPTPPAPTPAPASHPVEPMGIDNSGLYQRRDLRAEE